MESSIRIHTIPIEDPSQYSIPQDSPLCECFYINFCYSHEVRPSQSHSITSEMPTTTTFDETFLVPWDILCHCDTLVIDTDNDGITIAYLHDTFSSVPISSELLYLVLPRIGECARDMIEHNNEGRHILEMDVIVLVTIWPSEDDEDIGHLHAFMAALVNSLEKVRMDHDASSCSMDKCAICLEEFCNGSESKLVRTKCLHVFHEDCIVQWLQHCNTNQYYSCPLCRCQIMDTY